jgi:hypothetical protein
LERRNSWIELRTKVQHVLNKKHAIGIKQELKKTTRISHMRKLLVNWWYPLPTKLIMSKTRLEIMSQKSKLLTENWSNLAVWFFVGSESLSMVRLLPSLPLFFLSFPLIMTSSPLYLLFISLYFNSLFWVILFVIFLQFGIIN